MKRLAAAIVLVAASAAAHPGIGIVADSRGNIFYTDLKQVWRIAPDGQNQDDTWWLATRLGRDVVSRRDGLARLRAGERLDVELHPRIADDVRAEFLRGKFEAAV